ncbi:uncharacterized protein LOC143912274 [Arctopsyche grandis]|uniref:uncharacterized protein LOC143912274 n=1 Tax=Arctopsyche grandis TaxID=121162 RepID=UPI00406D741F
MASLISSTVCGCFNDAQVITHGQLCRSCGNSLKCIRRFCFPFIGRVLRDTLETFEDMYPKEPTEYTIGTTTFILPYDAWYPFDYQNVYVWLSLLLYQFHSGIIASIGNNICEWIFYTIVSHICIQFKILAYKIQTMVDDQLGDDSNRKIVDSDESSTDNNWKINNIDDPIDDHKIQEKLFEYVQTHQKLIRLCENMNKVFSAANFYNFCISAILICLVGFNFLGLSSVRLVLFLLFFLVVLIQIFFLCWFGNSIIETSTELSSAVFNSYWYMTGKTVKTTLLIMMLRNMHIEFGYIGIIMWKEKYKNLNDYQKAMVIIRGIFKLIGYRFDDACSGDFPSILKAYSCYFLHLLLFLVTIMGEIIFILKALTFSSFLEVSELAPCLCYCTLAFSKFSVIFFKRRDLKEAFDTLEAMYPKAPIGKMEQKYIDEFMGTTTFMLPYEVWYPFDYQNIYVWFSLLVYQFHSGFLANIGNSICEWMYYTVVSHICVQFKILAYKIQTVVDDQLNDDFKNNITNANCNNWKINYVQIDNRKIEKKLREYIQTHQKLIRLSENMDGVFSAANLYNFCVSAILICLVGFNFTELSSVRLVLFLLFFFASFTQIFFLCWFGNNLIETSSELSSAAFNSYWYMTGKSVKTTLLIMMSRSQKPLKFSASRFYVVSLKSFTMVMSTSWSYFTLLKTIYEPNK